MTGAAAKSEVRRCAAAARDAAHATVDDAVAQRHLAEALRPFAGRSLSGYLPIRSEIDPRPVMAAWNGPVGVPEVVAPATPLRFLLWHRDVVLAPGTLGVHVPDDAAGALDEVVPEVLIVPLLAFDAAGHRLGYGGGFYDRTLAALRARVSDRDRTRGRATAIGFAYAAQEVAPLPAEPTDAPLDAIVTEAGIRWFG